jgi:N-acetylglucosamine-6-phosphate deacetylase
VAATSSHGHASDKKCAFLRAFLYLFTVVSHCFNALPPLQRLAHGRQGTASTR